MPRLFLALSAFGEKKGFLKETVRGPMGNTFIADNGGRRSGRDRRTFSYAMHMPEMRSGKDRRTGFDRREEARYKIYKLSKSTIARKYSRKKIYFNLSGAEEIRTPDLMLAKHALSQLSYCPLLRAKSIFQILLVPNVVILRSIASGSRLPIVKTIAAGQSRCSPN